MICGHTPLQAGRICCRSFGKPCRLVLFFFQFSGMARWLVVRLRMRPLCFLHVGGVLAVAVSVRLCRFMAKQLQQTQPYMLRLFAFLCRAISPCTQPGPTQPKCCPPPVSAETPGVLCPFFVLVPLFPLLPSVRIFLFILFS